MKSSSRYQPRETSPFYEVVGGIARFEEKAETIIRLLDDFFRSIASTFAAKESCFPPVLRVDALRRVGYFDDFPNQVVLIADGSARSSGDRGDHTGDPAKWTYALVPAACYPIYLSYADSTVDGFICETSVTRCWRQQSPFSGLKKLMTFRQRKVVFLGPGPKVNLGLRRLKALVISAAASVGLEVSVQTSNAASESFDLLRRTKAALFLADEELAYGDNLPIAHTNFHRTHYSRRCSIKMRTGGYAYAGCFGLLHESWLDALLHAYDDNAEEICFQIANAIEQNRNNAEVNA